MGEVRFEGRELTRLPERELRSLSPRHRIRDAVAHSSTGSAWTRPYAPAY